MLHRRNLLRMGLGALAVAAASTVTAVAIAGPEHAHAKVGAPAPTFTLPTTDGKTINLADYKGKVVVLEWFNPQCPYVVHHHSKTPTMSTLYNEFHGQGVEWIAINSGAPGKEGAGLDLNKKMKSEWNIAYPVALDESGAVGHMYGAKTTPHMFIIDKDGTLVYAGGIDNDRSLKNTSGATNYVRDALNQVLAGETVTTAESAPYGCSVKYAAK